MRLELALVLHRPDMSVCSTYNQLHDIPESVGSEISGETLRMLRGLVVNFVAEVMSRATVWRERERVAKLQTKAWRLRENQVGVHWLYLRSVAY